MTGAETKEYVDMMQVGIIDPTKVERVALQNGASIASLLLTSEALITDLPEDKSARTPPMSDGGRYYSKSARCALTESGLGQTTDRPPSSERRPI